ncbi:MAG: hypothetical protein ACYC5S_06385 [Thiobacillus sp.]
MQKQSGARARIWRTISGVWVGGSRLTRALTIDAAKATAKR